jgi:glutamate carboxypeptidase
VLNAAERIVSAVADGAGDDALELLLRLAAVDAPSGDVPLLEETADLLADRLQRIGATVRRVATDRGALVEARLGDGGGRPIMLLGHYDTVWPAGTAATRPPRVTDGVVTGPGVYDMRGGIAAALTALELVSALDGLRRPVTVLLTPDEETGSLGSHEHIVRLGVEASHVLVLEPPLERGGLKTRRKGLITFATQVSGRAAHAGLDPERGVSAVSELARLVAELEAFAAPDLGTTVNVGVIAGGTRSNVVAAEAMAEVDVRVATMAEHARILEALGGLTARNPLATVRVDVRHSRPPMERTPAIAAAIGRAAEIFALAGVELSEGAAGGASDGNLLAPLGVAVLDGLGPEGGGAHALDEHVLVTSLRERVMLHALLLAEL